MNRWDCILLGVILLLMCLLPQKIRARFIRDVIDKVKEDIK